MVFMLVFLVCNTAFANEERDESLLKYDNLYQDKEYELIVKELAPAVAAREQGKESPVIFDTGADIVYARNLVADSYRMLEKYTQAAVWYDGTYEGYFDSYALYSFGIIKRVSYITGKEIHYKNSGGYFKVIDDVSLAEKQKYYKDEIIKRPDKIRDLELYRFFAGEISLENLLQNSVCTSSAWLNCLATMRASPSIRPAIMNRNPRGKPTIVIGVWLCYLPFIIFSPTNGLRLVVLISLSRFRLIASCPSCVTFTNSFR